MYKRRSKGLGVGLRAPSKPIPNPPDSSQSSVSSHSSVAALRDIINKPCESSFSETDSHVLSQDFFDNKSIPASTPILNLENNPTSNSEVDKGYKADDLHVFTPPKAKKSPEPRAKRQKRNPRANREEYMKQFGPNHLLSYLEDTVLTAGFLLQRNDSPNILKEDQAIFIRNISKTLKTGSTDKNVTVFMQDFKKYHEDKSLLLKALSLTQTSSDCYIARGQTQDSLVHLLLQVDCLEPKLTQYLLDKMAEFAMEEEADETNTTPVKWIRMILQSFRFLNRISDSSSLTKNLFDIIYATSDTVIQREIIVCIPDIIGDMENYAAATELSKLLREKPELTAAILDALTNLSLQSDTRLEVQQSLMKALRRAPVEYLPSMVKFLISVSSVNDANEVIDGLRQELFPPSDSILLSQMRSQKVSASDIASSQKLVFNTLRYGLLVSKLLADTWLKNIESISTANGLKPLDIVILLILYSIAANTSRKKAIEAIFRNKVLKGFLKTNLMEEAFSSFIIIVKDNFTSLMKIASVLLKSPEVSVTEFASELYCKCFALVDGHWCKWIVTELLMYIGAGDTANTRSALLILNQLAEEHVEKLKNYAVLLMSLLNKMNEIGLNEVRMLMDTVARIAYSSLTDDINTDCYMLQDEINMLARKQLASSQMNIVRNGVVSTVMIIKHIASVPYEEPNEWPDRASEVDHPLTLRAKKAFPLLDLVMSSTRLKIEAQGLFFDQLSKLIFRSKNLDRILLYRISLAMKNNLQESFLINVSEFAQKENTIEYALQYSLEDQEDDNIALDLATLVVQEHKRSMPVDTLLFPLLILPSLVRLLRALESEDLSEIDALLLCPVTLPTTETLEKFIDLSPDDQVIVMDCLFYCINWFREIINAFSCFVKKIGDKVLMRLRLIIWLQNQIAKCLPKMMYPEYCPPKCHFHVAIKSPYQTSDKSKKKPGKKAKKNSKGKKPDKSGASTSKVNDTAAVLTGALGSQTNEDGNEELETDSEAEKIADLSLYNDFFRELDVDVWLLLTYKLIINQTPENKGTFTPELGPDELLFLLEDFVFKLEHSLTSSVKRISHLKTANMSPIGLDSISSIPSLSIAKNCLRLIPELCSHRNIIVEFSKNLLLVNDNIIDARGMFMEESKNMKLCLGLIFKAFAALFSWTGFKSADHYELLKTGLRRLANNSNVDVTENMPVRDLVEGCCNYLCCIEEQILHLSSASSLVSLYQALNKHVDSVSLNENLGKLCYGFLKRKWYTLNGTEEKGSNYNKTIETFLSNYLSMSENRLDLLDEFISLVEVESQNLTSKDSALNSLPTFTKSNFSTLMKSLCKSVDGAIKQGLNKHESNAGKLEVWTSSMNVIEKIVQIVKKNDSRSNLIPFVSGSLGILRLFNTQGIPVCSDQLRSKNTEVSHVLRKLQIMTRYMQTICNHTKVAEDSGLAARLPHIRCVMETIVLQVKHMVLLNGCSDAFYLGSMRNKDLKGQEIQTQSTMADEDIEQDNEMDVDEGGDSDARNESDNENNESSSDRSVIEDSSSDCEKTCSSSV